MPSTLNPNDGLKKVIQTTLDELEAGLISERAKAALKAVKARGVSLGRHGAVRSQVQGGGSATCERPQARRHRTEGQGLITGKDRGRVEQTEVADASRWAVGSLVGAECAPAPHSLNIRLLGLSLSDWVQAKSALGQKRTKAVRADDVSSSPTSGPWLRPERSCRRQPERYAGQTPSRVARSANALMSVVPLGTIDDPSSP